MFTTGDLFIMFDEMDLSDTEDITIEDLQNMDSQMNNARLDISRELRIREGLKQKPSFSMTTPTEMTKGSG